MIIHNLFHYSHPTIWCIGFPYSHLGIYVKISASYVKRCTLQSDDRQTNTQTNTEKTYRVKTEENCFIFKSFFIFYFRLKRRFPMCKPLLNVHVSHLIFLRPRWSFTPIDIRLAVCVLQVLSRY